MNERSTPSSPSLEASPAAWAATDPADPSAAPSGSAVRRPQASRRTQRPVLLAGVAGAVLLLASGAAQRYVRSAANAGRPAFLPAARLAALPLKIGTWQGVDRPLEQSVLNISGADDHVLRVYADADSGRLVELFIGYTCTPRNMFGHRPASCYPAHGWTHVDTRPVTVDLPDGGQRPCLVHYFTRSKPTPGDLVVLNYYVLDGEHTTELNDIWGPRWTARGLNPDPVYLTQVQVVGRSITPFYGQTEQAVKAFAAEVIPRVAELLPSPRARRSDASHG